MSHHSINITINNFNIKEWNPKSISLFITLLGIPEACQLKQSNNPNIDSTISFLDNIVKSKSIILPTWMGKFIQVKDFYPILDELKEFGKNNYFIYENLHIPSEFNFCISMPKERPKTNKKNWIKWCFAIKLLLHYSKKPYPLDFLAIRGLFDKDLSIYPNKNIALNIILSHLEYKLPKIINPIIPQFPKYLPPYIEMHHREELWSNSKKKSTIDLRTQVWFHILAFIAKSEEINSETILQGINGLIKKYKENNEENYIEIIGNSLSLCFIIFPNLS